MSEVVLKTKKISKDEAMELRKDHLKSVGRDTAIMKAAKGKTSVNEQNRTARFIMSTESVDRYRDVVAQAGLDTTRFMENPQGLMFHNSRSWPIGLWQDVEKVLNGRPRRTEGTLKFLAEGIEPDADRAFRHVMAGTLRAVSIGFIPDWDSVEMILDDDDQWTGGFRYPKSELIECSVVPIPAQPDALIKSAGDDGKLAKELVEYVLDNWAKDPATGLLLERKDYESAYRIVRAKAFDDLIVKAAQPEVDDSADAEDSEVEEPETIDQPSETKEASDAEKNDPESDEKSDAESQTIVGDVVQEGVLAADKIDVPSARLIKIDVDTKGIDDATEKVNAFSALIDGVGAKLSKIFGISKSEQERIEPKVDTPPSPEAIQAAVSRVKAVRERIEAKGLA